MIIDCAMPYVPTSFEGCVPLGSTHRSKPCMKNRSIIGVEDYSKLLGMASKALHYLPRPILQTLPPCSTSCPLKPHWFSLGRFVHVVAFVWNASTSPVPSLPPNSSPLQMSPPPNSYSRVPSSGNPSVFACLVVFVAITSEFPQHRVLLIFGSLTIST